MFVLVTASVVAPSRYIVFAAGHDVASLFVFPVFFIGPFLALTHTYYCPPLSHRQGKSFRNGTYKGLDLSLGGGLGPEHTHVHGGLLLR